MIGTDLNCRWLALCALTIWWPSVASAVQVGSVVLGSYSSLEGALKQREQLEQQLSRPLEISQVDVRGVNYYRITTVPTVDLAAVEGDLGAMRASVDPSAWVFRQERSAGPPGGASTATVVALRAETPKAATTPSPAPEFVRPRPAATPPIRTSVPAVPPSPTAQTAARTPLQVAAIQTDNLTQHVEVVRTAESGIMATEAPIVIAKVVSAGIRVDGKLDEDIWRRIPGYDNYSVIEPDTFQQPEYGTIIRMFYTDDGLYVGVEAMQPKGTLIARLSSRDQRVNRDGTDFVLDPGGDGRYAFSFGVNLGGSLSDGTVMPEYSRSYQWDGPWLGQAAETDYGYSTEMFLPWSMMAMPDEDGIRRMGFYSARMVAHKGERWGWPALAFSTGKFISALQPIQLEDVQPQQQLAFFPFSATTTNNMYEETSYRTGMDIFWRPSTNLQMSATLNPDFGSVESDDVVINLTAFETFFPEKRLFFLEGQDIFTTSPRSNTSSMRSMGGGARMSPSTFHREPTALLNTRRIGGPAPTPDIPEGVTIASAELGKPTALMGAAKVTGQVGALSYGFLGAAEEDTRFRGTMLDPDTNEELPTRVTQDGRDFSAMRLLYENTDRGRKALGWLSTMVNHPSHDALVHGVDLHYRNQSGSFRWDGQLLYSDVEDVTGSGGFFDLSYIPKRGWFHRLSMDYLDRDVDITDFGFTTRNDLASLNYGVTYQTSNLEYLRRRYTSISISQEYNLDGQITRSSLFGMSSFTFLDNSRLGIGVSFYPSRWDDRNSRGNGIYRTNDRRSINASYGTDSAKKLSASILMGAMEEDLENWSYMGSAGFTFKPNDRFSVDVDLTYQRRYNWLLHLSSGVFGTYEASTIQPKIAMDLFLSAKQQLRFTMQWAGIRTHGLDMLTIDDDGELMIRDEFGEPGNFTISRMTSQLRYRWEIAPLSDLFVVYTRGSNLPSRPGEDFDDLFHDAATDPVVDLFVVKLRYRFGQ